MLSCRFILSITIHTSREKDYLKNQTVSATYYEGTGWFGELTEMKLTETYKIKLAKAGTLILEGNPVDPGLNPIDVNSGWNWIGYISLAELPLTQAMSSIEPIDNDYIKTQELSASYYEGFGWFGELTQMIPLEGYMFKSGKSGVLIYPDGQIP